MNQKKVIKVLAGDVSIRKQLRKEATIKAEGYVSDLQSRSSLKREFYRKGCIVL